jgi:hypothetical protein
MHVQGLAQQRGAALRTRTQVRLDIQSSFSSPFNKENFEVEWTPSGIEDWRSIG